MFDHIAIYPLTLLFVFVVVLLLIGVVYGRVHWLIKAVLIILSLAMFYTFYMTYVNAVGWPVATTLPAQFKFIAVDVSEPNLSLGDPGAILVWVRATGDNEPRAYKLPYRLDMHKLMAQAQARGQRGQPVYMESKSKRTRGGIMRPDTHFDDEQPLTFVPPPNSAMSKD